MTMKKIISPSQYGFTLLELLLVVGVAAILMLGAAQMVRSWANTQSAKAAGNQLQNIASITESFVADNWGMPLERIADISMTGGEWQGLLDRLAESGLYDVAAGEISSPAGTKLKIAFQEEGTSPNRVFRTIIYSTEPIPNNRVLAAARNGGPTAGVWTRFPDSVNARGAYNQWSKDVAFLTTPTGGAAALISTPPSATEGYLVSMSELNESQAIGPYLYRTDMGSADLNTMGADLDMGGNDITGLNNLSAETMTVSDTANFNNMNVTGNTQFPNGMTVEGTLISTGSMTVGGDMNLTSPMTVAGTVNAASLNVGTLQATQVEAASIDTPSLTVNNGNLTIDGNMDLGTGTLTTNSLSATDCVVISGTPYAVDPTTCPQ